MIRIKADHKNRKVYIGIDKATPKHRKAIRNASFDIGKSLQREVRSHINNIGKTGRTYKIGNRVHRASAPGEAPAKITGNLKRSVDYNVRGWREVEFGYKEFYGRFLELGTKKMEERPNLRPAADNKAQEFINGMVTHYAHR